MKQISKTIVREVKLPRLDPAFEDTRWVVKIGPNGIGIRRYGTSKDKGRLISWRSLIGVAVTSVRKGAL